MDRGRPGEVGHLRVDRRLFEPWSSADRDRDQHERPADRAEEQGRDEQREEQVASPLQRSLTDAVDVGA